MGYFDLHDLQKIHEKEAYYISRLKLNSRIYHKNDNPGYFRNGTVKKGTLYTQLDMEELMNQLSPGQTMGISEAQFRADVKRAYNSSSVEVSVPDKPSKPAEVPTAVTNGIAFIEGYNVNLRKGPGTSYSKIRQLNKPESYVACAEKDGWLNLGGEQWVKNDPSYVKFSKKSTVNSSIIGKRVVSKVNNLRFYDAPSWQNKDDAGSVDTGLGFTIDAKVNVN